MSAIEVRWNQGRVGSAAGGTWSESVPEASAPGSRRVAGTDPSVLHRLSVSIVTPSSPTGSVPETPSARCTVSSCPGTAGPIGSVARPPARVATASSSRPSAAESAASSSRSSSATRNAASGAGSIASSALARSARARARWGAAAVGSDMWNAPKAASTAASAAARAAVAVAISGSPVTAKTPLHVTSSPAKRPSSRSGPAEVSRSYLTAAPPPRSRPAVCERWRLSPYEPRS